MSTWGFLTNHCHVLVALSRDPELRQRDIAEMVGITEGAVHRILADLCEQGYVEVERVGRRNRYRVNSDGRLRHPIEAGHTVGELLRSLIGEPPTGAPVEQGRSDASPGSHIRQRV